MFKKLVLALALLAALSFVWAQGAETFDNCNATTSYADSSFVGNGGITWTYSHSRDEGEYPIQGKGLMLRRASDSYLQATIPGGIGNLSFQARKAFTGGSNRKLELYVNDALVLTTEPFGGTGTDPTIFYFNHPVDTSGSVTIKFKPQGASTTNQQITLDNIVWSGFGSVEPTIQLSGNLDPFNAHLGTPSEAQSYHLLGSNLSSNISVTAPAGFALSTDNASFSPTLSLATDFSGLIYVRLTSLNAGSFSGNIVHSSTPATSVNMAVQGTVTVPDPTIIVQGTLNNFTTYEGTPSAVQSYQLSSLALTHNINVQAPAGFSISDDNITFSSSLSLVPSFEGLIYVRLDGSEPGQFSGNISHSSIGAEPVQLAVNGNVSAPPTLGILLEEEFNYIPGSTLISNGWIAHSGEGTNSPVIHTDGLLYPGYPLISGFAARLLGNGEDVHKTLASDPITNGTVYSSFLINVLNGTAAGDYVYHFMPHNSTSDFKAKFFVSKDSNDQVRFGLSKSTNADSPNVDWTEYAYELNTTYLVVLKYEFVDGASNDLVSAWINPPLSSVEPTPILSAVVSETDVASISAVAIRQSNANLTAIFDGIRVTNEWFMLFEGEELPESVIHVDGEPDYLYSIAGSPSDEVTSYNVSGENLLGPISVIAPVNFQISLDADGPYRSNISLPTSFDGPVYVRLNALEVGEYGGFITHNSLGATEVSLRVDGEALPPDVIWSHSISQLHFESELNDEAQIQSYSLSANNANTNLILSLEGDAFLMRNGLSGEWTSALSLPPSFDGNIYVKMLTTQAGTFEGEIKHSTNNASDMYIQLSGTVSLPAGSYALELFFSEYIEGSSNNKAIEIFNGTGVPVDLSDYRVELYSNGATTASNTLSLSGSLAHGDVYVIANSSANPSILALADITSTVTYFSGDDALALKKISTGSFVDIFGVIGDRPASPGAWTADGGYSTIDKTLVRKPDVVQGVSVNPSGHSPNSNEGFATLASEWIVYPIDTISHLGSHVFSPGADIAAAPVISPPGGLQSSPVSVSMSSSTPNAQIRYTLDGSLPSSSSTLYSAPFTVSSTTTVKAITFASGYTASPVSSVEYIYPIQVENLAALRTMPTGANNYYQLMSEAVLTFQQSTRNTKYIQDATGAIVIDDAANMISTRYNLYDGITGIVGSLNLYANLLQFVPALNSAAATSHNNVIIPELRTLASLQPADQAKLVKIRGLSLNTTNENFGSTAENINVSDASGTAVMRTFPSTDYSQTPIPTEAVDLVCLVGQFNNDMQVSPRWLADFEPASDQLLAPTVQILEADGIVVLSWDAIAGANSYRIESSNNPYSGFVQIGSTSSTYYSKHITGQKEFYRVIAE